MNKILLAIMLGLAVLISCATESRIHTEDYEMTPYREDAVYLFSELKENHKDFFRNAGKKEAYDALDSILRRDPESAAEEYFCLQSIAAIARDSHTQVAMGSEVLNSINILPVAFRDFDGRLCIIAADEEHAGLLGMEVQMINGTPIDGICEKAEGIIPHDNDVFFRSSLYSNYMRMLEFYRFIGIQDDSYGIKLTSADGRTEALQAIPFSASSLHPLIFLQKVPDTLNPYSLYSAMLLPDPSALLICYHSCSDMDGYPFSAFTSDVMSLIRERGYSRIIIDLRYNGGGDSRVIRPLVDGLRELKKEKGIEVFALIGEGTFSSAILNAEELKSELGAVLVGRPTGGSASHFGELKSGQLPNSSLMFQYSTKYFRWKTEGPLVPDITVEENIKDYSSGIDSDLKALGVI